MSRLGRLRAAAILPWILTVYACSSSSPPGAAGGAAGVPAASSGGSGASGGVGASGADARGGASGALAGAAGDASGPVNRWASWPMPNSPAPGVPNARAYEVELSAGEEVVRDRVTGLSWQRTVGPERFTWRQALAHCDAFMGAGHADWRLPSRIELVSLLDLTRTDPSIDRVAFPDAPSDWFWTASRAADSPTSAWYVYFYFGYPGTDDAEATFRVRCVR